MKKLLVTVLLAVFGALAFAAEEAAAAAAEEEEVVGVGVRLTVADRTVLPARAAAVV